MNPIWSDTTDENGKRKIRYNSVLAVTGDYGPADLKIYFQAPSATLQIAPTVDEMYVAICLMAKAQWDTFHTQGDLAIGNWVLEGVQLGSVNEIKLQAENLALKWEIFKLNRQLRRGR